jgi:hypothetical protein
MPIVTPSGAEWHWPAPVGAGFAGGGCRSSELQWDAVLRGEVAVEGGSEERAGRRPRSGVAVARIDDTHMLKGADRAAVDVHAARILPGLVEADPEPR